MTTSKDEKTGDATKKSLQQNMMPIPPHASKTLKFPLFASEGGKSGYEPFIEGYNLFYAKEKSYATTRYKMGDDSSTGELIYNQDNSPVIATISIAYSTTEDGEKAVRRTKDFHVNKALMVKDTSNKNLDKVLPDRADRSYFVIFPYK